MATRHYLIGEGDDRVGEWYHNFSEPMEKISRIIKKAKEHDVVIKWKNIIPKNDDWRRLKRSALRRCPSADMIVKALDGVESSGKSWGGDSPGCSGCWVRLTVESGKLRKVRTLVCDVAQRLEEEWGKTNAAAEERRIAENTPKPVKSQLELWD
jgi:hypothetical protein